MESDLEFLRAILRIADKSIVDNTVFTCAQTTHGWFIYAQEPADMQLSELPHRLCIIMIHARRHGCEYVLLDEHGPEDPDLPVFEPG